jgi:hypothetical protein
MIKKKKKGDPITRQPDNESVTTSSYSGDDIDDDYIVFEDDTPTTISDSCWNDIYSDEGSSTEDSTDADTDHDSSDAYESDSEDQSSPPSSTRQEQQALGPRLLSPPTLVINIRRTIHAAHSPSRHVRFNDEIITHVVEIEDRKGYWIEDRFRFQQRCTSVRDAISFIFEEVHRRKMRLIVNLSDTLRGAVMPYTSGGMYGGYKQTDRSSLYEARPKVSNPITIFSHSNISRDHTTIMRPMNVVTKRPYAIALPTPTWWRS